MSPAPYAAEPVRAPLDPIALTRSLVDIDSTTGQEAAVGNYLADFLEGRGFKVERIAVAPDRFNVYASSHTAHGKNSDIVLSTHMDTVPPFMPSSEDDQYIYGRGSCDAKGIIAAQIAAAERLLAGKLAAALLFTVGEERDSIGAKVANGQPRGSRFLINGEPTGNRLAVATKGTLKMILKSTGKMAHSAYPELGDSAIHKLVHVLEDILKVALPTDPDAGPATLNIGTITGGHAPNVIADGAEATVLVRLVGSGQPVREALTAAVDGRVEIQWEMETPFLRLRTLEGIPTMTAAFATDIPYLSNWGEPVLFGPGSIHSAHTPDERLAKAELLEAIDSYVAIAQRLLS